MNRRSSAGTTVPACATWNTRHRFPTHSCSVAGGERNGGVHLPERRRRPQRHLLALSQRRAMAGRAVTVVVLRLGAGMARQRLSSLEDFSIRCTMEEARH
ncbi:hypothetical protein PR202_ga28637 [Eleusine coracana subsp. coracana]|uniref:Uncharacterized protein n=1 Tax=Eleusine coracana subsp. coracana TaxID=191504 RepID=A0AAV5DJS2_ELECO|nr:hypothetical protein PR202_ga28637 [Eleusine coracana subsp. coracana]